jgi:NhaP-type Na+/H+ and K+/H+ antiporter
MADVGAGQRGVISGMLNLSRNLGLVTRACVMGALFALASGTIDITAARPEAVATGTRITFAVAAMLIVLALAIAVGGSCTWPRVLRSLEATRSSGAV